MGFRVELAGRNVTLVSIGVRKNVDLIGCQIGLGHAAFSKCGRTELLVVFLALESALEFRENSRSCIMAELIHGKICALMADVGSIGKDARNADDGFDYRSVEQVCQRLQPLLVKHELYATCEIVSQQTIARSSVAGSDLLNSVLRLKYTVHAVDGSCISSEVVGEGIDPSDKASNKAMSVGFKYFWCQLLCIPYGSVDPDAVSHKTGNPKAAMSMPAPPKTKAPDASPPKTVDAHEECRAAITRLAGILSTENISKAITYLKTKLAKNQLNETQYAAFMKEVDALAAQIPKGDLSQSLMLRIEKSSSFDSLEAIREEVIQHGLSRNISDIELKQLITLIDAVAAKLKD